MSDVIERMAKELRTGLALDFPDEHIVGVLARVLLEDMFKQQPAAPDEDRWTFMLDYARSIGIDLEKADE